MRKSGILLIIVIVLVSWLEAKDTKVVPLPDLMKPAMMLVKGDRIFFTEQTSIYIYSRKDFNLIKKFGKPGEGPREFKLNAFSPGLIVFPFGDQLVINSDNKVSFFTRDGKFVKEMKTPGMGGVFVPIKDKFIGTVATSKDNKIIISVQLFDSKLDYVKELFLTDFEVGAGATFNMPTAGFYSLAYKEKIFSLIGSEGFVFDVFDTTGKKIYRIKKDFKPVSLPDSYKKETLRWFKNDSPYKQYIGSFYKVSFKTHYPAVKNFFIDNDKLYVITYKQENNKNECVILDLKGKELKRVFLSIPPEEPLIALDLYGIQDNIFYSLVENEHKELWELHIEKIK
jgi:hypothetical protein